MAFAMALHYLGYSFARPTTMALFTSATTGYAGNTAALPLAMAFISPFALVLLMGYGRVLDKFGPRGALMQTSAFCSAVLSGSAFLIVISQQQGWELFNIPFVKFISGPLFIFRESYVALLTSQYWSFIASTLSPAQSAKWFAPIAGLTSFTSVVAGLGVKKVVKKIGLPGSLLATGSMLLLSLIAANGAYSIAEKYGFNPADEHFKKQAEKESKGKPKKGKQPEAHKEESMITTASKLFKRVPVLGALFMEILTSQGLATLMNVCFITTLTSSIPDDAERAGWMGKFFALINVISMTLQFTTLPQLMRFLEPKHLWRALPLITILFTTFQSLQVDPSLYVVSASLLAMKALEYSARRMLDEMVYVPLDYESRYVGKEVIGVFGYRFGKSAMSLALSAINACFGNLGIQQLSMLTSGASFLWLSAAWKLSNLVPTRKEADEAYNKRK
eukprot:CAMPEP_0195281152 /NCGR_PEP_ID=MMETSP0707-20130614/583_1 /TAXON_ID=33640 /ORGANISM="Asterionellopsis glacialis, Strain CCMP134" /LENGTH=446 /DNA_ID=CAMNT_0040340009 /DNA_START=41 /DNA_END=1381 /DNA_ORIENTATION=-